MKLSLTKEKKILFIKTSVWNSFVEVFVEKKDIDIKPFIISVTMKWRIIFVKLSKPIVKTEANLMKDKILEKFQSKIINLELKSYDFDIKFV